MISNETAVIDVEKDAEITPQKTLHARNLRYDALLSPGYCSLAMY